MSVILNKVRKVERGREGEREGGERETERQRRERESVCV